MQKGIAQLLLGLAGLALVAAVVACWTEGFAGVSAEGFSRASSNLALIAIGLSLCAHVKS